MPVLASCFNRLTIMKNIFILILCLLTGFASFGQGKIDYQNKRLLNSLKKNGITGFSRLKEMNSDLKGEPELLGKFFSLLNKPEVNGIQYIFIGRVNSCRAGGCSISGSNPSNQESEYFEYLILYDSDKTVKMVEVYNYAATHGYEITAKGWLKQFAGFSGNDTLEVNKNIDAISGATISVFAITNDVQLKTKILKSMN